jgi:hypothetical protein
MKGEFSVGLGPAGNVHLEDSLCNAPANHTRSEGYFDFDGTTEIEEAIIVLPGMVPCAVTS